MQLQPLIINQFVIKLCPIRKKKPLQFATDQVQHKMPKTQTALTMAQIGNPKLATNSEKIVKHVPYLEINT